MNKIKIIENILANLEHPVVIIGMMGVGKTRLGRILSDTLSLPFVDSDDEIEKAAGMDIKDIFEKYGEKAFRDGERRVIKRLIEEADIQVVSTGGGAVMDPETEALIFNNAVTIWVYSDLKLMLERTAGSDKRPLLNQGDHQEIINKLIDVRYPIYEKANIAVKNDSGVMHDVMDNVLTALESYLLKVKAL